MAQQPTGFLMETVERCLAQEPMTIRRLCANIGVSRSTVQGSLGRLMELGRVKRTSPTRPRTGERGGSVAHEYSLVLWTNRDAERARARFAGIPVGSQVLWRERVYVVISVSGLEPGFVAELVLTHLRNGYPHSVKLTSQGKVGAIRLGERGWRDTGRRLDLGDLLRVDERGEGHGQS